MLFELSLKSCGALYRSMVLGCCLLPVAASAGTTRTVDPGSGNYEYWYMPVSVGDAWYDFRGKTKLEAEWNACQGLPALENAWAAEHQKSCTLPFTVRDFHPTYLSGKPFSRCIISTNDNSCGPGSRALGAVYIKERRTDLCPPTHPNYIQASNQCGVNPNTNLGDSSCSLSANSVQGFTGNKYHAEKVYSPGGGRGLGFAWHYNSLPGSDQGHWRHTYQSSVATDLGSKVNETAAYAPNLPTGVQATITTADGNIYKFRNDIAWATRTTASAQWQDVGNNGGRRLETATDAVTGKAVGFTFYANDGRVEGYSLDGRLQRITDKAAHTLTVAWQDERIASVSDAFGNAIQFHYDAQSGKLSDIQIGASAYRFRYQDERLTDIVYPDDTPDNLADNPVKHYAYEDTRFPDHLSAITDQNGHRSGYWTYDDQGRAITSGGAAGSGQHTLSYNADGTTTISDPLNNARTYTFTSVDSLMRVESTTGGKCLQCGGSGKAFAYDAKGLLKSKTDWRGTTTTYVRDDLGRVTSRTEAKGLAQERSVETEWHPVFNKPQTITQPKRITEFTYDDASGNLLRKVERTIP